MSIIIGLVITYILVNAINQWRRDLADSALARHRDREFAKGAPERAAKQRAKFAHMAKSESEKTEE